MPAKKNYRLKVVFSTLLLLVCFFAAAALYFYWKSNVSESQQTRQEQDGAKEEEIIREVGMLMILPEGEIPTVATVSDLSELSGHPFFLNAEKGDRVLIYRVSGRIVLYRPLAKKIVEAGFLNSSDAFPDGNFE